MVTRDTGAECTQLDGQSIPRLVQPRVTVLKPTRAVFSAYFDAVYEYVEKFHGPLAATVYQRPYTGRAQ